LKIIDKYVVKSFLTPFLATFLVVLFVLVMQTLWLRFDQIAGKGIDLLIIFKFLGYLSLMMVPTALPISILLSSIMAMGNLSENYEYAALKSAGISLQRIMRPLIILSILLSLINFLFLNNVFPKAAFNFKNLLVNMQKKKPELALIAGTFNTDIPSYTIKFDKKFGPEKKKLKNVIIYDLSKNKGNNKVITAAEGKITSEKGSKYMTFILKNGYYYEDVQTKNYKLNKKRMPFIKAHFDKYIVNIDISALNNVNLSDQKYKKDFEMLSLKQLNYYTDSLAKPFHEYIKNKAKNFYIRTNAKNLELKDSLKVGSLKPNLLDNFTNEHKIAVIDNAKQLAQRSLNNIKAFKKTFYSKRKIINIFDVEYYKRIAFSVACLVLFFIGAPLGAIIRKGGFGLPMIFAIAIFVIYYFISILGRNMAMVSSISAVLGAWLATLIMLPFGILLTRRATKDKELFNIDSFFEPINRFFKYIFKKIKK